MRYNDFAWNGSEKHDYRGAIPVVRSLERVLYHCPFCNAEGKMFSRENEFRCDACGNSVTIDSTYSMRATNSVDSLTLERIDQWYFAQRTALRNEILQNPKFRMEMTVRLRHENPECQMKSFRFVDMGVLRIDQRGLQYLGMINGQENSLFFPIEAIRVGVNIDFHHVAVLYDGYVADFMPEDHAQYMITKLCAVIEELHALVDPAWDVALRTAYPELEVVPKIR